MFELETYLAGVHRPLVMGIVNATGDSFSEGSASSPETALDRALRLLDEGADLLDIGGESTRPGSAVIPPAEEIGRVVPLVRELRRVRPSAVLSIDTRKSEVAAAALEYRVEIINDVAMLRYDPRLAEVTAAGGAALVLSHSRGTPQTMRGPVWCDYGDDVAGSVVAELKEAARVAIAAGVPENNLLYDPGFGFAKRPEQDWELLKRVDELHELGPVLAGLSRKSMLGWLLGQPDPAERLAGTVAASLFLADRSVEIIRVHDVRQVCDALKVREKLLS
ncbi:dihydropteroate synthase [Victivallis vadensis]|uniref:dihydropteroate synthase n=1 Tax=Victivallis vadensis TaxID=172901 RepID=UPI003D02ACC1